MQDLGTLGGPDSFAYFVADDGLVVGASTTAHGGTHAFVYRGGAMSDLGTLGGADSDAVRANAQGHIVGWSATVVGARHAFLCRDGAIMDLNSLVDPALGWVLVTAVDINDSGQIVGHGTAPDGAFRAFLLTPASIVARSPERAATQASGPHPQAAGERWPRNVKQDHAAKGGYRHEMILSVSAKCPLSLRGRAPARVIGEKTPITARAYRKGSRKTLFHRQLFHIKEPVRAGIGCAGALADFNGSMYNNKTCWFFCSV